LMVKSSATWILNHNHCCHSIYMPCNEFIWPMDTVCTG
jgi:hypothetical protein